jgi:release factor glutamine methyltransferase
VSRHALKVAKTNADYLEANVTLLQSNLLADYPFSPDIILANLPYVDRSWERSPETKYEPAQALFATEDGLHLIYKLISQTSHCMQIGGFILLEADPCQHATLIGFAKTHEFTLYETRGFVVVLQKN